MELKIKPMRFSDVNKNSDFFAQNSMTVGTPPKMANREVAILCSF